MWGGCGVHALPPANSIYSSILFLSSFLPPFHPTKVACHNSVGFGKIPITVINVDGFYDGIIQQIARAASDKILYSTPDDTMHVEATVKGALTWCAGKVKALKEAGEATGSDAVVLQARTTTIIFQRRHSFLVGVLVGFVGAVLTVGEGALLTHLWKKRQAGRRS